MGNGDLGVLFSFSFSLFFTSFCHAGNMHIAATHLAPDRCNSAAWCNKATPHCVTVLCWGPAALCQTGTLTHLQAVQLHGVEAGATLGGFQSCSTAHLDALDPVVALLSAQPSPGKDLAQVTLRPQGLPPNAMSTTLSQPAPQLRRG